MSNGLPYAGPVSTPPSGAYGDLLRIIREINRAVVATQLPATLGAQVFIDDPQKRREFLQILDLVNTMTGAPLVGNAVTGGIGQVRNAPGPERGAAMRNAASSAGLEALLQSVPALRALLMQ